MRRHQASALAPVRAAMTACPQCWPLMSDCPLGGSARPCAWSGKSAEEVLASPDLKEMLEHHIMGLSVCHHGN